MGEVSRYPNGTFCWIELATGDVAGAKRFHKALYGWDFEDVELGQDPLAVCLIGGKEVAAIALAVHGQPSHWGSSISTDNVDGATARAKDLGATVLAPPADLADSGRLAVVADPTGAVVSLWQPKRHIGARLVNEIGAWTWNDLATPDTDQASAFYSELFGWRFEQVAPTYFSISMGMLLIGGMRDTSGDPSAPPPNWTPYFVVENVEDAGARVSGLGGAVIVPATEVPAGRFSVYQDPTGAFAGMVEMSGGPARGVDGP